MTTASEVKSWLRPLLMERPDLRLVGRNLIFAPVGHIVRGIYFGASSSAEQCEPRWYVSLLFGFASNRAVVSFHFKGAFLLKRSSAPDFQRDLLAKTQEALALDFSRVLTIADFLAQLERLTLTGYQVSGPSHFTTPFHHATVLAALGRIAEARAILSPALTALEEMRAGKLVLAKTELARRSNSALGKFDLESAGRDLATLERLRPLSTALESGDRMAIGALLHDWEWQNAKAWHIEPFWARTPFPVELGEGD